MSGLILEAKDLRRSYEVRRGLFGGTGIVKALAGVSFTLAAGRTLSSLMATPPANTAEQAKPRPGVSWPTLKRQCRSFWPVA